MVLTIKQLQRLPQAIINFYSSVELNGDSHNIQHSLLVYHEAFHLCLIHGLLILCVGEPTNVGPPYKYYVLLILLHNYADTMRNSACYCIITHLYNYLL